MLKEHNIPVYKKLEDMMSKKNRAIVVTATGTGKSYLTLEYINNHNLNTLVVVPRHSIGKEWDKMSNKITTITYHSFVRTHNFDKYDCVVFDEVHHAGAATWETPITNFITTTDKPVIGLTADPKRYSDGARDMGEVLFNGCRIDGYNLTNAIENKILPKLTYVAALWDIGSIRETYRTKDIPAPLMARFNYALEKRKPIEEIIKERMPSGSRKGIIFVENITTTKKAEKLIKSIYPRTKVWTIHSRQSAKDNERFHNEFRKAKSGFMIAVDMYNEGLHAPGVNTIIMLRRTSSPTIFYQQIGRALHVGKANDPIIFDCVSNRALLKITSNKRIKVRRPSLIHNIPQISDQTVVYDYTKDILDVIKEIEDTLDWSWTDDEIAILRQYYPIEGFSVAKRLPGRTPATCSKKANELRIYAIRFNEWSEEEDETIRKYFPDEGSNVFYRMEGRSREAIRTRAKELGLTSLKHTFWTEEEYAIIRKYYPTEGTDIVKRLNNRTKASVIEQAKKLGVKKIWTTNTWTDEEDTILKENFPIKGANVCANLLGRKKTDVTTRARKLGLHASTKRWTKEEDELLMEYYPTEGKEVYKRFSGRSDHACIARANLLGLTRK